MTKKTVAPQPTAGNQKEQTTFRSIGELAQKLVKGAQK